MEHIYFSAAGFFQAIKGPFGAEKEVPDHDGDVPRCERWSHGPALPPQRLPFADHQAAPDDGAEHVPPKRKSYIVLSVGRHDVPDRFGCAGKDEDLPCAPKLHDRLVAATRWERAISAPAQSREHPQAPCLIGCAAWGELHRLR
jgi:hypothetical protein